MSDNTHALNFSSRCAYGRKKEHSVVGAAVAELLKNSRNLIGKSGRIASPDLTNFASSAPDCWPDAAKQLHGRGLVNSAPPDYSTDK